MTITTLQADMLRRIARSEFNQVNGGEPATPAETATWTAEIIENPQDQGVWTSLLNAGLINGAGGKEGGTVLTEAGFRAYKDLVSEPDPIETAARTVAQAIPDHMPNLREIIQVLGYRPSNHDLPMILARVYTLLQPT